MPSQDKISRCKTEETLFFEIFDIVWATLKRYPQKPPLLGAILVVFSAILVPFFFHETGCLRAKAKTFSSLGLHKKQVDFNSMLLLNFW